MIFLLSVFDSSNLSEPLQLVELSSELVLVGDERVVIELYLYTFKMF